MNVYEKLQQCRVELQQLKLKQGGENKFAGFKYYELADFLPAVNVLFNKQKLFSNFSIITNEQNKEVAVLTIINTEKVDEALVFESPTAEANLKGCTPVQSLGGVHTYMKRYLYLNAMEIVEPDLLDTILGQDDKKEDKKGAKKSNKEPLITEEQLETLNRQDEPVKAFALKKFGVDALDKLTEENAAYIIYTMKEKGTLK